MTRAPSELRSGIPGGRALDAVVGLGSNLGDRRATLESAIERLAELGEIRARSLLYETDPVGPPQPDFLNAAVRLQTALTPVELLRALLGIERDFGRERREKWGPRTLDLDLLWIRDQVVDTPELVVPHPRLLERAFALVPLLDVAPEAADPRTGTQYEAVARALDRRSIHVFAGGWQDHH